ncbi:hypothetical protein PtA15_14A296 [Puccinia triticina]|uniref:Uncharacterized protein n=1 Tax=Puccinia triticina TaxID=208348 RepID=A0ABY7D557_9BASI|nr:uncharacterized protein PtA15_14A296 [Puccinia triticina]WAQ91412.1 hypothetical protein PtA15_14A296 [Puccinia triticina]
MTASSSRHQIDYKFPDPTDPLQFASRPEPDSLIESPHSSPRNTAQSDTDWSILSTNPKPPQSTLPPSSSSSSSSAQNYHQENTTQPPQEPPPAMPEDQHKCQLWIENLPPAAKEPDAPMIDSLTQTVLPSTTNQKPADPSQSLDYSQYTTDLGPNDSASQCVYHRPPPPPPPPAAATPAQADLPVPEPDRHPAAQTPAAGGAADCPLDPAMDLSSSYLTPELLLSAAPPNPALTPSPSAPRSAPADPGPPAPRPASSQPSHAASKGTPSPAIPPKTSPPSAPAQAPHTPPRHSPAKSRLVLFLFMSAASVLVYRLYSSRPQSAPLNHPLARGPAPTEDLFRAAIINEPRVVEEDDTAPIVPHTEPAQVVLLSRDETEPDDDLGLASVPDIDQPEKDDPSPLGAPPIVPDTEPHQVVLLSRDESEPADDLQSSSAPDTHQPVQSVESPAEEESPNPGVGPPPTRLDEAAATEDEKNGTAQPVSPPPDRRLPPPDYVFWTPVFALIGTLLLLPRWISGREEAGAGEPLSVDELLSSLEERADPPGSFGELRASLAAIARDGPALARLARTLKSRARKQGCPPVELGLLAWTASVAGNEQAATDTWARFWALLGAPSASPTEARWLALVEQLGRAYNGPVKTEFDDGSSVATLKASSPALKPDPDGPTPDLPAPDPPARARKSAKRKASLGPASRAVEAKPAPEEESALRHSRRKTVPAAALVPQAPALPRPNTRTSAPLAPITNSSYPGEPRDPPAAPPPTAPTRAGRRDGPPAVRSSPRLRDKVERKP